MADERRSDIPAEELFRSTAPGSRTIKQNKLMGGSDLLYSKTVIATLAEIIAGKEVLPEVDGISYTIIDADFIFAGTAATATSIDLESTEDTPKTIVAVPVAAADDGDIATTRPLTANVTTGSGFRTALTAGKGVNLKETGSTLTGTTSVTVNLKYTQNY